MVFAETFEGLEPVAEATAHVEWETDSQRPGHVAYRISGRSRAAVQAAIDTRLRTVARVGGTAEFLTPIEIDGVWWSCGYTKRQLTVVT